MVALPWSDTTSVPEPPIWVKPTGWGTGFDSQTSLGGGAYAGSALGMPAPRASAAGSGVAALRRVVLVGAAAEAAGSRSGTTVMTGRDAAGTGTGAVEPRPAARTPSVPAVTASSSGATRARRVISSPMIRTVMRGEKRGCTRTGYSTAPKAGTQPVPGDALLSLDDGTATTAAARPERR